MSNFEIELPNLNVDVSDSINKTMVVLRQPSGVVVRSSTPIVDIAQSASFATYALTASIAINTAPVPAGTISSSAQISQSGFVSSSTINTIQTITSASYSLITPVSGTLYIIID